ncbi:MAG: trypsin-like peptidase domain-containing protein [Planctomycetes bacterium]|nr:trypsin-like peptidase domain-containing protein [Planctomycetota bacterium]
MRHTRACCAAVLAAALFLPFAFSTDPPSSPPAKFSRSNPVTEAVKKTKPGVVAIRIPRQDDTDMVGAGVIVDERGLIVTNRHVTAGKKQVKVRLHDGSELLGDVVLADCDLDLAIVKITTDKKLTALPLGPTDLMVGETVLAIGSPYGYDATVSRGIISAVDREIKMPNDVVMSGLIQHDAPINPGNSGGPLVNINAEVIGINVAMRSGAQNIAFAINTNTVQTFLERYARQVSGVKLNVNCEEKVIAEVGDRQRVVVKSSHADLKSGDEIRVVGDVRVANTFDIQRALWAKKPGQQVEVQVHRAGRDLTVRLTVEASQGAGSAAVVSGESPAASSATAPSVRTANDR